MPEPAKGSDQCVIRSCNSAFDLGKLLVGPWSLVFQRMYWLVWNGAEGIDECSEQRGAGRGRGVGWNGDCKSGAWLASRDAGCLQALHQTSGSCPFSQCRNQRVRGTKGKETTNWLPLLRVRQEELRLRPKHSLPALCMLNDMHGHAHGFCVLSIYSDASFSSPCHNLSLYTFSIFISQKGGIIIDVSACGHWAWPWWWGCVCLS